MNLSHFVRVFDDALPEHVCRELISHYEAANSGERRLSTFHEGGELVRSFTDFNVMASPAIPQSLKDLLVKEAHVYRQAYVDMVGIEEHQWQVPHGMEDFRIKRYLPGKDRFMNHVDVDDYPSARRFLAFFWYLNTPNGGGETEFYNLDKPLKVEPKTGRLVMFPPLWMFPHAGLPTTKHPKYIMGGYLHYV